MSEQEDKKIEETWLQKNESKIMLGLIGFAVLALITVIGFYTFKFHQNIWVTKPEELGTFGDFIGGILNPIFAFLAFLILAMSFRLQSKELKETREELARASDAQASQARLAEKQIEQVDRQNFENLFFKLLDLKARSLKDIFVDEDNVKSPLRYFLQKYFLFVLSSKDIEDKMAFGWSECIVFEKYVMSFYVILEHINTLESASDKESTVDKKYTYLKILMSTMNIEEKIALVYFLNVMYERAVFPFCEDIKIEESIRSTCELELEAISNKVRMFNKYDVFLNFSLYDLFSIVRLSHMVDVEDVSKIIDGPLIADWEKEYKKILIEDFNDRKKVLMDIK